MLIKYKLMHVLPLKVESYISLTYFWKECIGDTGPSTFTLSKAVCHKVTGICFTRLTTPLRGGQDW